MSNYLAIATVTATLSQLIQDAIDHDVPGGGVSTVRPDIAGNTASEAKVNIYLYQVTTNTAFRNVDLPTRRSGGSLAQRSKVALDLHYLLTFYGDEGTLVPQQLLGSVTRTLHSEPQLTRTRITEKVNALKYLKGSNLAEDVELVKFTPLPLSLEELSKLWSILLQTPYALSMIYLGTVVLIEDEETPIEALPVKQPQLFVMPFRQPVIEQLLSQKGAGKPALPNQPIVVGDTLILAGRQLQSTDPTITTEVQIAGTAVPSQRPDATHLRVIVPDTLQAGVQGVQVVQVMNIGPLPPLPPAPATPHGSFESNITPFVLRPTLQTVDKANVQDDGHGLFSSDVTIQVTPQVGSLQRVMLVLNQVNGGNTPAAYAFVSKPHDVDTGNITFSITGVQAATYLVRVQVDGAESVLDDTSKQLIIP